MRLKLISESDRPVERIESKGVRALSSVELLAVLIGSGTRDLNVLDLSALVLSDYPVERLQSVSIGELEKIKGVGRMKAARILAAFELSRRVGVSVASYVNSAADAFELLCDMKALNVEETRGVFLNSRNRVLSVKTLATGTLTASIIHPREVIKSAINSNAVGVIVAHNHPSGDPTPSLEDVRATKVLLEACGAVGLQLVDHVIIGESYFSFKEKKII